MTFTVQPKEEGRAARGSSGMTQINGSHRQSEASLSWPPHSRQPAATLSESLPVNERRQGIETCCGCKEQWAGRPRFFIIIDGEAIVTNELGLAVFDLIRHKRHGEDALLIAFDLIELDGEDLRRTPIEQRKRILAKLARRPHAGLF
jgi:hypothetical protein